MICFAWWWLIVATALALWAAVCTTVACCLLRGIRKAQDGLAREQFRLGNRIGSLLERDNGD